MADEKKLDAEGNEIIETKVDKTDDKTVVIKIEVPKTEPGKSYSAEDAQHLIDEALQAGQKIAKGQLYPEITKLKDKLGDLEKNMQGKVSPEELARLSTEKAETEKKLAIIEESYIETNKKVEGLTTQLATEKLESYKQKKIAGAEGEIIPELVTGNTPEEIDASIEKSKAKYSEIQTELRTKFKLPEEPKVKGKGAEEENKVEIPRIGGKPADLNKWASERDKYLKEVYSPHGLKV